MATKKSICVLFGILVIWAWVLGSATQAGAETMNYRGYTYADKAEEVLIGDVEDHTLRLETRRGFYVFENGEVATILAHISGDYIKGAGSYMSYTTITFADGSTIVIKRQAAITAVGGVAAASATKGEVIKGTGRFVGMKGTLTSKSKILPREKGEAGQKAVVDATITYTLPPK